MLYLYGILLFTIVSITSALPADTSCSCQRNMAPVCGSDGTTYNNECLFNCARTVNTELIIQNYGRCGEQECFCNYNYSPVCGTDGRTYANECSLRCLKTKTPQLDVKHIGKCNTTKRMYDDVIKEEIKETQVAESPKDFVKVADPNTDNVDQECFCTHHYSPVCGTDGRTYGNVCSLRCLKKKIPQLDVKHTGKCNITKRMYDDVTQEEGKESRVESPKDFAKVANPNVVNVAQIPDIKNCNCITQFNPVCGTNSLTYINPCHLNCASLMNGGGIHVFSRGPCQSMTYGIQVRCSSCSLRGDPVCGANGVTYANACLMRCVGVEIGWPGVCAHNVQPLQATYYIVQPRVRPYY